MPGELHEYLVDEVRFGFNKFVITEGARYQVDELVCLVEHIMWNVVMGGSVQGIRADCYLHLDDKNGWIPVEVGYMDDGKWNGFTLRGEPLRVLRVGFDGSVWMLNKRHTQIESDLIAFYEKQLPAAAKEFGDRLK